MITGLNKNQLIQLISDNLKVETICQKMNTDLDEDSLWYKDQKIKLEDKAAFFREMTQQYNIFIPEPNFFSTEYETCDFSHIKKIWEDHSDSKYLSMYLHIPFCKNARCSYCLYESNILENREVLSQYMDFLFGELDQYQQLFKNRTFHTLYIGGGTPSLLSENQMDQLLRCIFNQYHFHEKGERTVEVSPSTVTFNQLKVLKENGINRISIGVQSLDEKILANEQRPFVSFERIASICQWCSQLGFSENNVDIMTGLSGDDGTAVVSSFLRLCQLKIPSISVYSKRFLEHQLSRDQFKKHYEQVTQIHTILNDLSETLGYRNRVNNPLAESQHFVLKDHQKIPNEYHTRYNSQIHNSCLGIGSKAQSFITNHVFYKCDGSWDKPNYQIKKANEIDRMRAYIINQLYEFRKINKDCFEQLFGVSLEEKFSTEIQELSELKLINNNKNQVNIVKENQLDLGVILKFFYKPSFLFQVYLSKRWN